jgi:hypothetical protein
MCNHTNLTGCNLAIGKICSYRLFLNQVEKAINMLIQNRITVINLVEMIDLSEHFSHFRENLAIVRRRETCI